MCQKKTKSYSIIAVAFWMIFFIGIAIMGCLERNHVPHTDIIYYILFFSSIMIVFRKDKSVTNLGLCE